MHRKSEYIMCFHTMYSLYSYIYILPPYNNASTPSRTINRPLILLRLSTMTLLNAATFTLKLITNPVLTLTLLTNDAHGNETLFGITHHLVRTLRQTLHEISYCSSTNIFHRTTDYTLYSTDIPSALAIVVAIT